MPIASYFEGASCWFVPEAHIYNMHPELWSRIFYNGVF